MDLLRKDETKTKSYFGLLYILNFIVSFHLFFVVYFNSNFLSSEGLSNRSISLIYIIGSVLSICGLFLLPKILKSLGNYSSVLILIALELVALFSLAFANHLAVIVGAFIAYLLIYPLILISFDIFLEGIIKNENTTGGIRGIFLTITNSALIIAPLAAGFLIVDDGFKNLYLIAGILLIPLFVIVSWYFKGIGDPVYKQIKYRETLKEFKSKKGLLNIFISHLALRIFFSFMVIYTPLFLYNTIGFTFAEIGILFAIMLLPFVLFEIPLGKIADRWLGEKEILIIGFLIAGLSTVAISFITATGLIFWTILLFITRTGASAIEITTESYFFKHVEGSDAAVISLFRMLRPLGYILGPVLGAIALGFVSIQFVFIIPGLILLLGILPASQIVDTK